MSQILEKAKSNEQKGKFNNAASSYFEAAQTFQEEGNVVEAKQAYLKALENAEKAQMISLIVDIIFSFGTIATKKEKADAFKKVISPIDQLIADATSKNNTELLSDYMRKKIESLEVIGEDTREVKKELGSVLFTVAKNKITHKKEEERKLGQEARIEAINLFDEISEKELRLNGENEIFNQFLDEGYLKEGLQLLYDAIIFCKDNKLLNKANELLEKFIAYGKDVLDSKASKKLIIAAKTLLNETDPGGKLLDIAIEQANIIVANEKISDIASVFAESADFLFSKKKYLEAARYYDKAIALNIEINNSEKAKNIAINLIENAKVLFDTKGKFEVGLEFYSKIEQIEKIDLIFVGDQLSKKATEMFQRKQIKLSLEDYIKAARAYLKAEVTNKFNDIIKTIYQKSNELIIEKDLTNALLFAESSTEILTGINDNKQIGSNLTNLSLSLIKTQHINEAEDYSIRAIEAFIKSNDMISAANSHKIVGESLLRLELYQNASAHLIESSKLFKIGEKVEEIIPTLTPLVISAKNLLAQDKEQKARDLILSASECAKQIDPIAEAKVLSEFADHAINNLKPVIAYELISQATSILGKIYPIETKLLIEKSISMGKKLIPTENYVLGKSFIENAVEGLLEIDENVRAGKLLLEIGQLFQKNNQTEIARELLNQISKIMFDQRSPIDYAETVSYAAKNLIQYGFVEDGIEQLRKSIGSFLSQAKNDPVIELSIFCSDSGKIAFQKNEHIIAKHLFISAMEFSSLVNLEIQDKILTEATTLYLEKGDLYSLKEFYDFARNNLEGEKDYLGKLGRLIIIQGASLRDTKQLYEESSDLIREGIKIFNQIGMYSEAGEAALAQGNAFLQHQSYILGEELIETAAQIFLDINDIERSGDTFTALTDINIARALWLDAFRQINLANKSYLEANCLEKIRLSIIKTAEIGTKALEANPKKNLELANKCYETAIKVSKDANLIETEIDIFVIQARGFITIKDYTAALTIFTQATDILEKSDEIKKSSELADNFSKISNLLILEKSFDIGIQMVDLATGIYMRLRQPINASEVYMKACNSLLKMDNVVEAVKLVLLASDTLMVANEYEAAANILREIVDLLFDLKDYLHASIVTGQIVTVHQKTGNFEEQKKAISKLVEKAVQVIKDGKVIEGEQLWEQAANYSISVNLEFAIETNNRRIETFLSAGMYNSVNIAFNQLLTIIEDDTDKRLIEIGDRATKIAANLFASEEFELSKNFIYTAVDYYRKGKNSEKAKNLCLSISQNYVNSGDEQNGIELIDKAANIANELEGPHQAALTYLTSGFSLLEAGFLDSGRLSVKKAAEIEKQAQNIIGCIELGEIAYTKAAEIANSDLNFAIEVYIMAVYLFEVAESYSRAGDVCTIVAAAHFNLGVIDESVKCSERAIDYYLKDKNSDSAIASAKNSIESARRLMDQNELTKAVLILERGRILVERIGQFGLLSLIIDIYISAANQNLPNRKSAIGIFFLNRALELAKSSPEPEENVRVINMSISLALDIINKKNSLAGAKVLEIISNHPVALELMPEKISETYIEALKLTIEMEWNMIGKITRDAFNFFKKVNIVNKISQLVSILTKRANADIITNRAQLGFFFMDYAIKISREANITELLLQIGSESFEQLLTLDSETDLDICYKLLGYCYQMFLESNSIENIERVGHEFVRLGSKDLLNDFHSIRGYEALLSARDISVSCQNENLMMKAIMALLDFAKQLSSENSNTTLSTLEDIVNGLEDYEVPNSKRAEIEFGAISDFLKTIFSFGEKLTKSDQTFTTGYKIIELCMRILVMTKNQEEIERDVFDVLNNMSKYLRRANRDSAYKLRHAGLILFYFQKSNESSTIAGEVFRNANDLFQKKKYQEALYFTETAIKLYEKLGIDAELRNIGMFALNAGDRIIREGKIPDAMTFYELAIEAFDKSKDEESSSRLINTIFQTREWDADISIAFKCYSIAADSAIRLTQKQKAFEVATKCFNRGIAFIDQPRIHTNLSYQFIELAGKTMEDIGAIKEAANSYDNALLKYIRLMKTRKNIEPIIIELLTKIAVDRMASCDMDSLETIFLRVGELAEMKKSKFMKNVAHTLKLIGTSKIEEAWNTVAALPFVSHGRIRRIMNLTKGRILYDLDNKGIFDRTIFSTTDRSLPLSDYLIQSLLNAKKIEGQPINKDVFIAQRKIDTIRRHIYSEYELWGRIEIDNLVKEFAIQQMDAVSIIRREFLSTIYMAVLNNTQNIFFSNDRLKAELSLIIGREKKKDSLFDPMQAASEMHIPPDIIKEVLREIACEEVVEKALEQ